MKKVIASVSSLLMMVCAFALANADDMSSTTSTDRTTSDQTVPPASSQQAGTMGNDANQLQNSNIQNPSDTSNSMNSDPQDKMSSTAKKKKKHQMSGQVDSSTETHSMYSRPADTHKDTSSPSTSDR